VVRLAGVDTIDLMSTLVVTVEPRTPLSDVEVLLLEYGFAALPVVGSRHEMLGTVSDDDVRRAVGASRGPRHEAGRPRTAADVMQTDVTSVSPATTLTALVGLLRATGLRSFPVLASGDLVGIVARRDIADALRSLPARLRAAVLAAGLPVPVGALA
jgi:CBS domain-containing protein